MINGKIAGDALLLARQRGLVSLKVVDANERQHRILVVEDEPSVAQALVTGLEEEGFFVSLVDNGQSARVSIDKQYWDLVLLDLMLPDISGESLLSYLTQRSDYPAVLVLTAKGGIQDKISLFRRGCDDYLTKPYLFAELLARIHALLRRPVRVNAQPFRYLDMELDPSSNVLTAAGRSVSLTAKESAILRLFLSEPERLVSRKEILHGVWCLKEEPQADYIGIYLFHLRRKLAYLERDNWLRTVRATGFVLCNPSLRLHTDSIE